MVWVGRDLIDHLVPTPLPWAGTPSHQTRLLKAPSSLALNTAREGAATASLGNLCQCLTTLVVKNFFLISSLNLPSFSFKPLPLVLLQQALLKSLSQSFLQAPLQVLKGHNKVSLQRSLLQAEQPFQRSHQGKGLWSGQPHRGTPS